MQIRRAVAVVSLLLVLPASAAAQQPPQSSSQSQTSTPPNRSADFLFGRPRVAIGVRGNWLFATAGSDIFDFVTDQLTIDKKDFNSPGFSTDVAFSITPRLDWEVGFDHNRMQRDSEYRDFVDNRLQPIEQQTSLKTMQITGGIRYALTPKGHEVSRLAWIPRRVVPYIGAGAGATFYQFTQYGDFVDFVDLSVFFDSFRSQGWSPSGYVYGGLDLQIYKALYGSVQGRYTKASSKLDNDFVDFDPIDLSGFRMAAGINVLF